MRVIHSAQFELSVDGVPRSYRDRKDLALQSARILKSRNPNSVVKLKDLQTGEEIVIAFKVGNNNALKLRPTGLGSGIDKDRPTTPCCRRVGGRPHLRYPRRSRQSALVR